LHPEGSSGDPGTGRERPRGSGGSSGECCGQESSPAENSLRRAGGGDVQVVVGRWCEGSGGDEESCWLWRGVASRDRWLVGPTGCGPVAVGSGGARMLKQGGRTAAQTEGRRRPARGLGPVWKASGLGC
jgi:hypothetical protein